MTIDTFRHATPQIFFVLAPEAPSLPLPSEQREIKERMANELRGLAERHLTVKEAKQIVPSEGKIC